MVTTHNIDQLKFSENTMLIQIDGKDYIFELNKISKKLFSASEIQRNLYTISPSGYGIHWPLIDEDLSVDSLLRNV